MTERLAFITACLNRAESITAICDRFGISGKTGYKWLQRFKEDGGSPAALLDRSHAPHTRAHRMTSEVATRILALRQRYPAYGPVKLRDWLVQHEPEEHWPAPSSIGVVLAHAGLGERAKRTATVLIQPYERIRKGDQVALAEEGARLLAFIAPDSARDVRFAPLA